MTAAGRVLNPRHADRPVVLTESNGRPVVRKRHRADRAAAAWADATALWSSPFGASRLPPGLAQPLRFDPVANEIDTAVCPGTPLADSGTVGLVHHAAAVADVLAALQRSGVALTRTMGTGATLEMVHEVLGDHRLTARLQQARPRLEPLVPAHGDLSAANVFIHEDGATLIDLDAARMAAPGHDAAHLAAWCWVRHVCREAGDPDTAWAPGDALHAALVERLPEHAATLHATRAFHRAAELVRCGRWARRSHGAAALASILAEAERLLDEAGC